MVQMFPVFNPVDKTLIGYKKRALVHTKGDWHRGIQANVLRKNGHDSFDILVQKRSDTVDIGRTKFDQSLATQMLNHDNLDEFKTLRRGLASELDINEYKTLKVNVDLWIVKTYEEHPDILNREIITLFLVEIDKSKSVTLLTSKTAQLFWMPWNKFLKFFVERTNEFTKTAQFYFGECNLLQHIEDESFKMLSLKNQTTVGRDTDIKYQQLIRIDRWPYKPKTYYGNVSEVLSRSGEIGNVLFKQIR